MEIFLAESRSLLEDFIDDIPFDPKSEIFQNLRKRHIVNSAVRFQEYIQVLWEDCKKRNNLSYEEKLDGLKFIVELQEKFLMMA